jgi:PAS domain S-box-containing protein
MSIEKEDTQMADSPVPFPQLPEVADRAPVLIWMSGPSGGRAYFNKQWLEFTGRSLERESGFGWANHVHPDDFNSCMDEMETAFDSRIEFKVEYRLKRHDGLYRWILDHGVPMFASDGTFEGYIGACTDISERREDESEIIQARQLAEEHSRMKDEFLATMCRELRLPLTPILGWTQMYKNGKVGDQQLPHAMNVIERNAAVQATLLEDLLDVSRIISGKIKLDQKPVGLAQVIEAAIDTIRLAATEKSIQIVFVMESSVGPVQGDPVRLQQILWNLLSNAIKFSPAGAKVEVRLSRLDSQARISVMDSGEGIAPERLPFLFDCLKTPAATESGRSGLNLGLSIVKQLAKILGGSVAAFSEGPGKGARFEVSLPIVAAEQDSQPSYPFGDVATQDQAMSLKDVKVLVVDDEADSRDLICYALASWGARAVGADSVRDAMEKFARLKPDIVVSDIGMPVEDGYVFIRKLRELDKNVPAIALTAFARSEDRDRAISSGYQQHVAKPVEPEVLISVVAQLVKRSA